MIAICILDAEQRSGLAAIRALGKSGFRVHAGSCKLDYTASSNFISKSFHYTDPSINAAAAATEISEYLAENSIQYLIPMTDISTHLVLKNFDKNMFQTPCPTLELYEQASDKARLIEAAQRCGIPTPRTKLIRSNSPLTELPTGFEYPVALKPTRSRIAVDNGYLSTSVRIAKNVDQFVDIQINDVWFTDAPWLLQQFVNGTGQGVFTIYDHGRSVAWFAHERIREKPPSGGVSVLSRSAPLTEPLKTAAKTLLDTLGWHGPAMVEFRVAADGTPYLMEINARFWGSLQLAITSGVNFPLLAAQIAMGENPQEITEYKLGIYNRWLLGDLDNLFLTLKAPNEEINLGKKLKAIGIFLIPWWPGLHYEINQWKDMGPFWRELKEYAR